MSVAELLDKSCWLAFCVQSGGVIHQLFAQEEMRWRGVEVRSFFIVALRCTDSSWVLVGNLQRAPRSLPGIINIAAILIKWQSRIASHSRGHLAHKSTASTLCIVLNQWYESSISHMNLMWWSCRVRRQQQQQQQGVLQDNRCLLVCDTNLNMWLCAAAKTEPSTAMLCFCANYI